ncbi:AAA family ATPase [Bradyrhizobium sp. RDM4]|uniref:AAA family ATPase n=1 Tax=Bradyrhizobium sp. RDM4 TaxID=3378765 RepID=UPI0038FC7D42
MSALTVRYLGFFGSGRKPADLRFEPGLNVICGASETGKSFITESIDFALGQESLTRDLPEGAGYDRVRLVIESKGYPPLTLDRSVEGGNYHAYNELLFDQQPSTQARTVRWKHAASRIDTLSYELLSRVGYTGRVLRTNARGRTRTLSFRDFARLCIITEEEIQRRGSPVLSGQFVTATSEYAAFKLMLTANDDSALVSVDATSTRRERDDGKIELLDQLIAELQVELDESGFEEAELRDQEERLKSSLTDYAATLQTAQNELNELMTGRAEAAKKLRGVKARMLEITELVQRFTLLDQHYNTDVQRLRAIHEAGTLFVHLASRSCPLCGALPGDQHQDTDCDGNTEAVIKAANAEMEKVERLRRELADTVFTLQTERAALEVALPSAEQTYADFESHLTEIVAPALSEQRTSYNQLMSEMSSVRSSLEKIGRLENLMQRRSDLAETDDDAGSQQETKTQISKSILDEFAQEIQGILEDWDYPDASRVFFDESKKDIQISGKERGSSGKGLRAITHAAFTIGLMQFCRERELPHPGFIILDSPLLAYWKPESDEDDLRGSSLKEKFYRYVLGMSKDSQIIIIENEHPPSFVEQAAAVTIFTKNPTFGRYGFFPR